MENHFSAIVESTARLITRELIEFVLERLRKCIIFYLVNRDKTSKDEITSHLDDVMIGIKDADDEIRKMHAQDITLL